MQVVLNVKNASKLVKPTSDSVLLYNGKNWYVTTKEEILKEIRGLLSECRETLEAQKQDNEEFKRKVSAEIKEMADSIVDVFEVKQEGENL